MTEPAIVTRPGHRLGAKGAARRVVPIVVALTGVLSFVPTYAQTPVPAPVPVPVGGPVITAVQVEPPLTETTQAVTTLPATTIPVTTVPATSVPVTTLAVTTLAVTTVPATTPPATTRASAVTSTTRAPTATGITTTPSTAAPPTTVAGSALSSTTTTTLPPPATPKQLQERLDAVLGATSATRLGAFVHIEGLGDVYERSADVSLPPASTQKLVTAGTALLTLGPSHRFTTSIVATAPLSPGGVLLGDLVLVAGGDPSLTTAQLGQLADAVVARGITMVSGSVAVDDSRYSQTRRLIGWKPTFVPGEVGTLSALVVAGNHQGDGATLADPAVAHAQRLRELLTKRKVVIAQPTAKRASAPANAIVLGTIASEPLEALVTHMAKRSDNGFAEQILLEVGAVNGNGSSEGGLSVAARLFRNAGIEPQVWADGSGLSSLDRATARSTVTWLRHLDRSPVGPLLRNSLPISCRDGTLRSRMCGTPAEAKVWAKTGALDGVVALAGYTTTASGRRVTFAFLADGARSSTRARTSIDRAVALIASYLGT